MLPDKTTRIQTPPVNPAFNGVGHGETSPMTELHQQSRRIEELMEQIESLPDLAARALLHECLQTVLTLHGRGLAQMLGIVQDADTEGGKVLERLLHDDVVRGLLLIHGLHPVDLPTRLQEALDKVRPYMESHGGNVELISLENDVARLRLHGTCKSCPSSAVTMELAVRRAIEECCPDLAGFEVEGAAESPDPNNAPVLNGHETAVAR